MGLRFIKIYGIPSLKVKSGENEFSIAIKMEVTFGQIQLSYLFKMRSLERS